MAKKRKKATSDKNRLVIVESPTKARTIRKYLGDGYEVESCMGHIRDLPQSAKDIPEKIKKEPWANLGMNVDKGFEAVYCIPKNKTKIVKALKDQLKDAEELILATDEDREGESISWHLVEVLKPKIPFRRMVFHEITEEAIQKSLTEFRDIDYNLVRAQEARRILDRLVGYSLSPLLWKKVAYGLSAGRVQSVAVKLLAEREVDRLKFKKANYWGALANCEKDGLKFESKIINHKGKRVAVGRDFDGLTGKVKSDMESQVTVLDQKTAESIAKSVESKTWNVEEVEQKPLSRKPAPPFITSTLQQEANRKLGFSAQHTMQVAQKLYEQGRITYMRTDSVNLSSQAIDAARNCIVDLYGKDYLPEGPRTYASKKSKGAQEAHEAIRPAGTEFAKPEDSGLSGDSLKLYDLVWKRTVASQMVDSQQQRVQVRFKVDETVFQASGMTILFPGFLRAYVEGRDDAEAALEDREVQLPNLTKGDSVKCEKVTPTSHETKPPARFTEASLVQMMEKEGIGRPSTYAAVIATIIGRGYVQRQGNALVPTFTALVVSSLLRNYLPKYVDVEFTSRMENCLDEIASGDIEWTGYLNEVYFGNSGLKAQVDKQQEDIDPELARSIDLPGLKDLSFRVGRYGAYVCREEEESEVCASIPEACAPGDMTAEMANKLIDQKINGADALGYDEETGLPVYILTGRYGPYAQLGDSDGEKEKPKRASIPPHMDADNITLEEALFLLALPKTLGEHPETGKKVNVGLGRFGPYVVHDGDYRSVPKGENLFEMTYEKAMELLAQPKRGRGNALVLQDLGVHPEDEKPVQVLSGKYGPYVKWNKTNVSVPDDIDPKKMKLAEAIELLASKAAVSPGKKKKKKKKKAAKKATKKKKKSKASGKKQAGTKKTVLRKKTDQDEAQVNG